jgi:hypothetical protein
LVKRKREGRGERKRREDAGKREREKANSGGTLDDAH